MMIGIDLTTLFIVVIAIVAVFLLFDLLFAGGGMTGGMMGAAAQCGAAVMGSPYGWIGILALVLMIIAAFGMAFGR
jgi:hypothetical protein